MDHLLPNFGFLAFAFLWGGIPIGYIVVKRIKGTDIRYQGSGNIGATNVRRVLGNTWFFGVLLLDALKGAVPILMVLLICDSTGLERIIVSSVTICGNLFSPWLGFRGGKGIGTGLGVLSVLLPFPMLLVLVVFVIILFVSNHVSAAAIFSAMVLPIAAFSVEAIKGAAHDRFLLSFTILLAFVITAMHRQNLLRLRNGTEPKFFAQGK